MDGFISATLAKLRNCQNGAFEPVQGDQYVSERFQEVIVRSWIDSEKKIFIKKKLLRYVAFRGYKTDFL